MENKEQIEAIAILKRVIKNRKPEIVRALNKSFEDKDFSLNMTESDLLNFILSETRKNNGFVVYNVGKVIDEELHRNEEEKSNYVQIIMAGMQLLGTAANVEGKKIDATSQLSAQQFANKQALMQQDMLLSQLKFAKDQDESNIYKEKKTSEEKTKRITIISSVAGVLLIGTILTVIILKRN